MPPPLRLSDVLQFAHENSSDLSIFLPNIPRFPSFSFNHTLHAATSQTPTLAFQSRMNEHSCIGVLRCRQFTAPERMMHLTGQGHEFLCFDLLHGNHLSRVALSGPASDCSPSCSTVDATADRSYIGKVSSIGLLQGPELSHFKLSKLALRTFSSWLVASGSNLPTRRAQACQIWHLIRPATGMPSSLCLSFVIL